MAKDNLKLKVAIDGDNKGFKKALTSTQRDIQKTQDKIKQKGGLGFGDVVGLSAVQHLPRALKAFAARKMMNSQRNVLDSKSIRKLKHQVKHNDGGMDSRAVSQARERLRLHAEAVAGRKQLRKDAQPLKDAKMMLPTILAGVVTTAFIATITKRVMNQNAFDTQSKGFSSAVMAHEAALEVKTIRRNLMRAKSPTFIAQQKRYANAEYYSKNGSTTTNGRNVATDVATAWEYLKGYASTHPDVLWNPLRTNYDIARGIF